MMFYHPETDQQFGSRAQAQAVLKVLSSEVFEVKSLPMPATSATQTAERGTTPTLQQDGSYAYEWAVTDLTDEEIRAAMPPLSRAQFAGALALSGAVTAGEARAWGKNGDLPSFAITAIENSGMTDNEKLLATIKAESATEIDRTSPIVALLQAAKSLTDAQVDALFTTGAAL